jgi:hypothetical protein
MSVVAKFDEQLESFEKDPRGSLEVNTIISLVIGLIVLAIMLPVALNEIMGVDTTTWDSSVAAVWDLLPILAVLAGLVMIVGAYKRK